MADDFQSGICSGGSWWNPARSASFDVPACSTAGDHKGGGTFGAWATATTDLIGTAKAARSCDDQSVGSASGSSLSFQDKTQTTSDINHPLMDSSLQLPPTFGLSSVSVDWPQASLTSGGRTESSFHALLEEDLNSRSYAQHDSTMIESINRVHIGTGTSSTNPFKDMAHDFSMEQQYHLSSGNNVGGDGVSGYSLLPASYGCSPTSTPLQALLLEPEGKGAQQAIYDNLGVNYQQFPMMAHRGSSSDLLPQPSWSKFSQLLKSSPPRQQPGNQLQFSNNTPFWNASAVIASSGEGRTGIYSPTAPPQFTAQGAFEPKPAGSNLIAKVNQEATFRSDSCSSSSTKNNGSQPAFKKPRMEALSPLPTFKVRKEKLGDRITALQQLVSPFGKTDTASVLHEAIEYIKFLHDQVGVLSTPYLKSGHPTPPQQGSEKSNDSEGSKQDLRSRGLCLVPIASTYPVASETTADFWHPTFGGTFR